MLKVVIMKSYNIAVIKGDGIGPEVVDAALGFIAPIEQKFNIKLNLHTYPYCTEYWLQNDKKLGFTDDVIN